MALELKAKDLKSTEISLTDHIIKGLLSHWSTLDVYFENVFLEFY